MLTTSSSLLVSNLVGEIEEERYRETLLEPKTKKNGRQEYPTLNMAQQCPIHYPTKTKRGECVFFSSIHQRYRPICHYDMILLRLKQTDLNALRTTPVAVVVVITVVVLAAKQPDLKKYTQNIRPSKRYHHSWYLLYVESITPRTL